MHPDLPEEQAYFDRALALRDRQQADLARAPGLVAHPKAAIELRRRVSRLGLADPDEAVAFGRIEAGDDRWYIGKGAIWDDDNDLVVVNWQAPIAAPFYTATPDDPEGLDSRRLFRCRGNQIREIEDLVFREVADAIATGRTPQPVLSDALLDALGSARSGELGDIVATIQASQYDVISRPLDELLVVQGGPGTGKTVVGLHRVSWLLFNRRDRLEARDVLIVGPNPAFVHYISSVLPSLGDEAVVQLPLRALGPRVRIGRVDPPALRRLKGDRRLLRLILRGLRQRQRVEAAPVELTVAGRRVELEGRRIATRARQLAGRPHNEGHRMLRAFVVAEARTALTVAGAEDVTVQGDAARDIDNYLDRVWPSLTPQGFLVDLFSSRRRLLVAGAGTMSDAELDMLALPSDARVSTWQWSAEDVPLLDTADALLNGVTATYEHIVVDEAQDLSPLQLESIRRRSRTGSMTVLGDVAQGTSPWAHTSWEGVVQALRHERAAVEVVELEYGYRLPAEVHEVAMRLLPEIAPGVSCPEALRTSGHEVAVTTARSEDELVTDVVATIDQVGVEGIVGVIAPAAIRTALIGGLDDAGIAWAPELRPSAAPVVVLTPDEAKGLEFDVVVVVEPAAVLEGSPHGLRSLFVALTRCTTRLLLVHARPLPAVLGLGPGIAGAAGAESGSQTDASEAVAEPPGGAATDPRGPRERVEPSHADTPAPEAPAPDVPAGREPSPPDATAPDAPTDATAGGVPSVAEAVGDDSVGKEDASVVGDTSVSDATVAPEPVGHEDEPDVAEPSVADTTVVREPVAGAEGDAVVVEPSVVEPVAPDPVAVEGEAVGGEPSVADSTVVREPVGAEDVVVGEPSAGETVAVQDSLEGEAEAVVSEGAAAPDQDPVAEAAGVARPVPEAPGVGELGAREDEDAGHVGPAGPDQRGPVLPPNGLSDGEGAAPADAAERTAGAVLDGLDRDIARGIAGAVAERLTQLIAPELLRLVADELARALAARRAEGAIEPDRADAAASPSPPPTGGTGTIVDVTSAAPGGSPANGLHTG